MRGRWSALWQRPALFPSAFVMEALAHFRAAGKALGLTFTRWSTKARPSREPAAALGGTLLSGWSGVAPISISGGRIAMDGLYLILGKKAEG